MRRIRLITHDYLQQRYHMIPFHNSSHYRNWAARSSSPVHKNSVINSAVSAVLWAYLHNEKILRW